MRQLGSMLDASQNFIIKSGTFGHFEARYVRRSADYVAAYVSSHYGCNLGSKFCHLTHMEKHHQNNKMSSLDDFRLQLQTVMRYVREIEKDKLVGVSKCIDVNFMGRGDALANATVVNNYSTLHSSFRDIIPSEKRLKMNISTIFPKTMANRTLLDIFRDTPDTYMYYSLYSINPRFRSYWLPNAIDVDRALEMLREYQENNDREITFHFPFIHGHNDCLRDVFELAKKIASFRFSATKFNLVRFDTLSKLYEEPTMERLQELFHIVSSVMTDRDSPSKIVSRVGCCR
jgi:adenine C2-methylase RlmN of 23S rRNA A2503 and tRNA A37